MKKNIVLLFGGQSTEHDISRRSVMTFIEHIDRDTYDVILLGITKKGRWLLFEGETDRIIADTWAEVGVPAHISPDATEKALIVERETGLEKYGIHAVIPVLHGLYGEDGSVQGLFRLAGIPYVGCGILASAVAMDKFYTKVVVKPLGIRQAKWIGVYEECYDKGEVAEEVAGTFGYPVFVKPSNAGSSIGVSMASGPEDLDKALKLAFEHDRKVLIEENIVGREVECAVYGNLDPMASDVGEIIAADDFYDFDAKYNSADSKTIVGAPMPEGTRQEIREAAVAIFKAVDGRGLSRVDFFIEDGTGQVVFNEINTFPGFTSISMYPMLMKGQGVTMTELINGLIDLAVTA